MAVEPRPAASVVLVRAGTAIPLECYLIRRARSMRFMGGFYALPGNQPGVLAWINFVLSSLGAIVMAVLLPRVLTEQLDGKIMMAAEIPAMLGMICFLISVISSSRKPAA